eukprot:scpid42314/ scgid32894/ 
MRAYHCVHTTGGTTACIRLELSLPAYGWSYHCVHTAGVTTTSIRQQQHRVRVTNASIPLHAYGWSYHCVHTAGATTVGIRLELPLRTYGWSYHCMRTAGVTTASIQLELSRQWWYTTGVINPQLAYGWSFQGNTDKVLDIKYETSIYARSASPSTTQRALSLKDIGREPRWKTPCGSTHQVHAHASQVSNTNTAHSCGMHVNTRSRASRSVSLDFRDVH